MSHFKVKVPASTANVGPGFDVFGLSLSLYNYFSLEESSELIITASGPQNDGTLSLDQTNLVFEAIQFFYDYINKPCPNFKIDLEINVPLASGLGSSSTAIVAGLALANIYEGNIFDKEGLLNLAFKIEGHPDNISAAIFGGFTVSSVTKSNTVMYKKIDWPEEWKILIAHPDFKVSTSEARAILPKTVDLNDAIYNMGMSAMLITSILFKDPDLLQKSLNDKLHQPYRNKLVPGMKDVMANMETVGAYGSILSGAGPSICIILAEEFLSQAKSIISQTWDSYGINCTLYDLSVDKIGLDYIFSEVTTV